MCILMGKTFAVIWNSCLLLQRFLVKNAKNDFLGEIEGFPDYFECSFYVSEV